MSSFLPGIIVLSESVLLFLQAIAPEQHLSRKKLVLLLFFLVLGEIEYANALLFHRTYKAIATSTASSGYRADLRASAVARASALRRASQPKKDAPEAKLRGAKARKAAEVKEE